MLRSTVSRALLLALATTTSFLPNVVVMAVTYTSGSATVEVSEEVLDDNNSTKKCVQFTSGAPEKYEKGCFSTEYTDGGEFMSCTLEFDEMPCNKCERCNTNEDLPGYEIDCNNIEPEEGTNYLCEEINDLNVQRLLVDDKFDSQPFNWTAAGGATVSSGADNGGDGNPAAENTGSAARSMAINSMGAMLAALSLLNLLW
jgi:hypothetical protein